jgi:N-acetylneuraminate synthase/N,N'-diacetyllegionaminate synthase
MRIGGREIGPGKPVYIIAEAGVAHNGDMYRAMQMIDAAREVGADAVKFQAYHADELTHGRATGIFPFLCEAQFVGYDFARLQGRCRASGIEFLCSPFDVPSVWMLAGLGVRALKIASPVALKEDVIRAAMFTELPLIISCGMKDAREMPFDQWARFLHCVSEYPATWTERDEAKVNHLEGYSDHTPDVDTGAKAVRAGACILEKHFTLDDTPTPDLCVSLKPNQLKEYIRLAREAE